jgi:hypothetical protein
MGPGWPIRYMSKPSWTITEDPLLARTPVPSPTGSTLQHLSFSQFFTNLFTLINLYLPLTKQPINKPSRPCYKPK